MKGIPIDLANLIAGYSWHPITIGHSEASTFLLTGDPTNYYLKTQPVNAIESLQDEKERLDWLQGKLPVPKILYYGNDEACEYILLSAVKGNHAAEIINDENLHSFIEQLAIGLKMVHGIRIEQCPFDQSLEVKLEEAKFRVAKGLVDEEDFDEIRRGQSAQELYYQLLADKPDNEDLVFTHGDYCLPNIMVADGKISGFIDIGRAGIADRYQDIALAVRSITFNLGEQWVPLFLEAYGAIEVDMAKIAYYQLLDEFF